MFVSGNLEQGHNGYAFPVGKAVKLWNYDIKLFPLSGKSVLMQICAAICVSNMSGCSIYYLILKDI